VSKRAWQSVKKTGGAVLATGFAPWFVMVVCASMACAHALPVQPAKEETPKTSPANDVPVQPAPKQHDTAGPTQPGSEPSLDELLGLPGGDRANKPDPPKVDPAEKQATPSPDKSLKEVKPEAKDTALDRALKADQPSDDFMEAVALMRDTSQRLVTGRDPGLETQRLQEQVLRKLDKMIDDAKKNQQQSKQQQKQQQQQQDQQQNQQQQQSSQSKQQQSKPGTQAQGGDVPQQSAQQKAQAAGASAAWGNLPPHVRDALLQGSSDRFSTTYQRLTEEYYKRLAAQEKTQGGSTSTPDAKPGATDRGAPQ